MRRTNQKFQQYDLVQLADNIPWISGKNPIYDDNSGKKGIVVGSYYDQYGGGVNERKTYTIRFEGGGNCSWYDEPYMTLIEEGRADLYEAWGAGDGAE